ncbi:MAG: hypothetical protein ACOY6K_22305 [Pseudomonadota bacterium]
MPKKMETAGSASFMLGLIAVAQALRAEVTALRGSAAWEADFRRKIVNDLRNANIERAAVEYEPALYEAMTSAVDMIFELDEGKGPAAGTDGD